MSTRLQTLASWRCSVCWTSAPRLIRLIIRSYSVDLRHSFGMSGTVLDWIASYLTGRTQFVRFNGQSSKTVPVTSGVPQGSVLGPILFLAYTAEVVLVVRKHSFNVHAYADDLQIYDHTAPSGMAGLLQRMATCIEDVSIWMTSNRLCLNPSKTELIWLGSSRRLQTCTTDSEMNVLGSLIRPVDSVRDLGDAHRQRLNLVQSCQQSRRFVLFPYPTTSHRATNIDGQGCALPGTSLNSQPDWLLQRYFGFQSEIPHWEATVSASCRRQTRPTTSQSLAHFRIDARSTSLAERRVESQVQAGSPGLQVGSRSGSGVPVCLLRSSVALARSLTSSIRWSVDYVRPKN